MPWGSQNLVPPRASALVPGPVVLHTLGTCWVPGAGPVLVQPWVPFCSPRTLLGRPQGRSKEPPRTLQGAPKDHPGIPKDLPWTPKGRLLVPVWSQIGFIQIPIWLPPVPIQLAIRVPIQVRIAVLIQIPFQFPIQAPVLIPIQRFHSSSHVQQLLGCFAGMI